MEVLSWLSRLLILAFPAVPAQALALLALFPRVMASTSSMQALACPAALALAPAPLALSKRHKLNYIVLQRHRKLMLAVLLFF